MLDTGKSLTLDCACGLTYLSLKPASVGGAEVGGEVEVHLLPGQVGLNTPHPPSHQSSAHLYLEYSYCYYIYI